MRSAIESMEIVLKNAAHGDVYAPGEIVHGVVLLKLREPIRARRVQLKFVVKAECKWFEFTATDVVATAITVVVFSM